jgi:hypothetical protein
LIRKFNLPAGEHAMKRLVSIRGVALESFSN